MLELLLGAQPVSGMNKRAIFTAYNAMRGQARRGMFDMGRLNRALGLAQRRERRPYVTSLDWCTCPDCECRRVYCKHRLREIMLTIAGESEKEEAKWQ